MNKNFKWWQEKTYNDCVKFFETERRCAITNATGTGKTIIMAQLINDYYDKPGSVIVITPRDNIESQYSNPLYGLKDKKIIFTNYHKIGREFSAGALNYEGLKLIVCDELHRTGAKTWMPAVEHIIDTNPNAKVLGASATPRRMDQKHKREDMIDVLFGGNRAGEFDIVTSLKKGILPYPIYVNAMYDKAFEQLENDIFKKINRIKDEAEKLKALNLLKESRINWEASFGYDKVINNFLDFEDIHNTNNKVLIFCKGKEHIKEMREVLDPIFKELYSDINLIIDEYHTSTTEEPFEDFRDKNEKGTVQILYSIDKFEEGVHVAGLNAVILIRDTESDIKYFQQIGRVLSISGKENPIIIDLVSNASKVKGAKAFFEEAGLEVENDLGGTFGRLNHGKKGSGKLRDISVKFYNTVDDAIKVFEEINNRIIEQSLYTYNDEKGTIDYFCEKYNKDKAEIYSKINYQDMTIKEAIETSNDVIKMDVVYNGETVDLKTLCKRKRVDVELIYYRLNHGQDIYEALREKKIDG